MTKEKKLRKSVTLAALALLTGTATLAAPAAWAASCEGGSLCVYEGTYKDGRRVEFPGNSSNWHGLGGGLNFIADHDSSWWNNAYPDSYDAVAVYRDVNYGGGRTICLERGEDSNWDWSANDEGSSNQWLTGC